MLIETDVQETPNNNVHNTNDHTNARDVHLDPNAVHVMSLRTHACTHLDNIAVAHPAQ